ncbi:MAG: multicopper oxidase domain-containing protein, partial [Nocardioides sp.]
MTVSRRDLIKIGGVLGAGALVPWERMGAAALIVNRMPVSAMPARFSLPFVRPAELTSGGPGLMGCLDGLEREYPLYDVTQRFTVAQIMPGYQTPVFAYNGQVPGPTIRAWKGQPIIVRQANRLQQPPDAPYSDVPMPAPYTPDPWLRSTSTHLHGSASLPQFDGYASDVTTPGYVKDYFYPNSQEARTLWYHDHAV